MALFFSSWMLLAVPIGLALLVYGGLPLLIYLTFKNEAQPTLQTFEPDDQTLPLLVREHFKQACDELLPMGFEYIKGMRLPQMADNVMAIMIVLVNRQTSDAVAAISIYAKSDEVWDLQTSYVEYSTAFQTGLTINTQNSPALSSFPPLEENKNYRFPSIRSAQKLYDIHQQLIAEQSPGVKVLRLDQEFQGDAVAFVQHVMNHEMAGAANDGYLYLAPGGKHYRATIKGAYLMTWGELFPFKQFRQASRNRLAKQQLATLGFAAK